MEHPTRAEPGRPAPIRLPRPERPAVSVLIPAYRQVAALERCLRALAGLAREAHLFETVLVLNGASRAVVELVDRGVSGATVLRSAANLGIAGALDLAAGAARGEHLLLTQDDVEPEEGWIAELLAALAAEPLAGAVGSAMLDLDGGFQSAGWLLWSDGTTSPLHATADELAAAAPTLAPYPVDYCGTSSLMIPRALWSEIGGADQSFFPAYYVDVDLCLAVRSRGRLVLCAPRSRARHRRGASTTPPFRAFLAAENRRRLLAKWAPVLALQPHRTEPPAAGVDAARRRLAAAADLARRGAVAAPGAPAASAPLRPCEDADAPRSPPSELELWQRYAAHLEERLAELQESYSRLEGWYRGLEAHAQALTASVAAKDRHIEDLTRALESTRAPPPVAADEPPPR